MKIITSNRRMEQTNHFSTRIIALIFCVFGVAISLPIHAQRKVSKSKVLSLTYNEPPAGYNRLGTTDLYYSRKMGGVDYGGISLGTIDLIGWFENAFYSSTYGNNGYVVSMEVNNADPQLVDCLNGSELNGVGFHADVEQQGDMARVYYTITNNNETDVVVSLGVYDDVAVGDNISPNISRKLDSNGTPYGMTLLDNSGVQLCVLFGSGLAGVVGCDDFWFGSYYINASAYSIAGHYNSGSNYMVENGGYDCGIGWCWKNRTIKPGQTQVFSYLIAVGEVNLEPNSSFEVTPDDPEGWNDLSRPHKLALEGTYESPAGLDGMIEYAVEDSEEWHQLTEMMPSGATFNDTLVAMFDATREKHVIRFRTKDNVGNTTLLPSIEYLDVSFRQYSGITDKIYTGDPIYQEIECTDVANLQVATGQYINNVNAGTASFCIEGVFPYTIGRKTYTFTIKPQPLSGEVTLAETDFVYNGHTFTPEWQFTNEHYADLKYDKDYSLSWSNNRLPGMGTLTVTGKNNYTGSLTATLFIDKAQLRDDLFILTLPDEDITYDEQGHGASISKSEGVGNATITYLKQGEAEAVAVQPSEAGDYAIFLEFADGTLYYGRERTQVGAFSIYQFNAEEWAILQALLPQLVEMGWSQPWDVSQGMKSVSSLRGLIIEKGHVTGLDLAGQNLTGAFPYVLLSLPQLQRIDLSNNNLSGDISTSVNAIAQEHPEWLAYVKEVDISGNGFSGNIAPFANSLPALTSLDASGNCLEEVTPAISSSVTTLALGKQSITHVIPLHLADLSAASFSAMIPNILLYDHTNQTCTTDIKLLCTADDDSWGMTIAYRNGQISLSCLTEQNAYLGESGDTLQVTTSYYNNMDTRAGSTFRMALRFDDGDGNFDGNVDILDLQTVINYMFEEYESKPYNFTATNLWMDDVINVQDAVCLVNLLLDTPPVSAQARAKHECGHLYATSVEADAAVHVADGKLMICSNEPVSAFDVVVETDEPCDVANTLATWGFTCTVRQDNGMAHIVGYSLSGATLPVGETALCSLPSGKVTYAMLADAEANEISSLSDGTLTAIPSVSSDACSYTEAYRISMGTKYTIVIDANGNKFMIKDVK